MNKKMGHFPQIGGGPFLYLSHFPYEPDIPGVGAFFCNKINKLMF